MLRMKQSCSILITSLASTIGWKEFPPIAAWWKVSTTTISLNPTSTSSDNPSTSRALHSATSPVIRHRIMTDRVGVRGSDGAGN